MYPSLSYLSALNLRRTTSYTSDPTLQNLYVNTATVINEKNPSNSIETKLPYNNWPPTTERGHFD